MFELRFMIIHPVTDGTDVCTIPGPETLTSWRGERKKTLSLANRLSLQGTPVVKDLSWHVTTRERTIHEGKSRFKLEFSFIDGLKRRELLRVGKAEQ